MRGATRVMIMAAALAISGVAATKAAAPAISGVATMNTSWWRLALAAPAIVPDFALLSKHVCERGSTFVTSKELTYFPSDCRLIKIASRGIHDPDLNRKAAGLRCTPDGLGHVGRCEVGMIAKRRGEPGARYFQQYVADSGAYLRDVDGLGDGFAPSLYCHERDWLNADRSVTSGCKRRSSLHHKQNCKAKTTCSWKEKTNECREKSDSKSGWPTGDALFRDHFECFLAPPFDEWFGFDALPPADDPAWGRRAVAETYAAVDRDAFVDCGAADGELRVVVHVRLGDLIHPDLSANASAEVTLIEMRSEGGHLRNALRVVAALRARLPGRRVHTLILSDSPPETVAATLEGLDVGIHVGGARRDGASHLVDGRTVGLENDFDVSFHGAGHPLVALHCMAAADLLLGPEKCHGDPWLDVPKTGHPKTGHPKTGHPKTGHPKTGHRRLGRLVTGSGPNATIERCSSMVLFARELSLRGVFRGLPVEPLDATAVDAGVEELLGSGFPVEPLDATAVDAGVEQLVGSGFPVEPLDATAVDAGDALLGSGAPELSRGPQLSSQGDEMLGILCALREAPREKSPPHPSGLYSQINQATQLAFDVATKGKRLDKLFSSSPVHNPPHVHAADDYGRGCGRKKKKATMGCFYAPVDDAACAAARAPRSAAAAKRALARNWTRYEALAAFTEVLWRPSAAVRATRPRCAPARDLPAETPSVALGVHVRRGDRVHDALSDRTGFTMFDDAEWVDFFAQRARARRRRGPKRDARGAPAIFDLDGKWTAEDAARGYAPCKLQYFLSSTKKRDDCGHSGGRHPLCLRVC
ncbi:hypothetical protein SO694_00002267 [Aureococcus anophagefferens]|uniref:GT23 domain-containing protein n=1 Tax=Aureococcus anophagefferens TaxID=44056 RepID=A0ABR1GCF9_AURAN